MKFNLLKNNKKFLLNMLPLIIIAMTACSEKEEMEYPSGRESLKVLVSINDYSFTSSTRAITEASVNNKTEQDGWSYRDFSDGDELGLYANMKKGRVENMPMLFSAGKNEKGDKVYSFGPSNGTDNFNPTDIIGSNVFMYFPYTNEMTTSEDPEYPGLELRTKRAPYTGLSVEDGPWRCVDFLVTNTIDVSNIDRGTISGTLIHSFSELIIMRGEGFDKPKAPEGSNIDPYKITVKLNKPYSHVQIANQTNPWKCSVKLIYENGYTPKDETNFDATLWEAWKGGNYGETNENPAGYEAWYVILPTMGDSTSSERSRVEYIELYDNEGNLQTIKDLYLSGAKGYVHNQPGNYLDRKWRYPFQISMQELVPTVFPFSIESWNEGNITNERTRGITQENFSTWLSAYNTYISSNRPLISDETLSQYGDKIMKNNTSYWHFYLLENLDMSEYAQGGVVIPTLEDVIDGKSSQGASPVAITNLTVPFVDKMQNTFDSLLNLTIERPYIDLPHRTPETGVLVNSLNSGGINNCTVNQGYINAHGKVGMFAGKMESGRIEDSKASGMIIGTSSQADTGYLVGEKSSTDVLTNNSSTVVFSPVTNQ